MILNDLVHVLQGAVSPVVLISGVGLLILSMTNRLARVVDRSRQLGDLRQRATPEAQPRMERQVRILVRRARLLRRSISYATVSVLMAALLVIDLFITAYLALNAAIAAVVLFVLCLVALIISLVAFLQDINLSLVALNVELGIDGNEAK